MSKGVVKSPSKTAMGTTLMRAIAHKEYDNEKFGPDGYAKYFLPMLARFYIRLQKPRTRMIQNMPAGMYELIIARTQYFDNLFSDALEESIPQIVLLGAGYDTRAFRFAKMKNTTRIFELDIETTQGRKKSLLKKAGIIPPGNLTFVPIDFNKDSLRDALAKAGFDGNERTLFLWEGVTYYLEPDSINTTLGSIMRISNAGTRLAFDYLVDIPRGEMHEYYGMEGLGNFMIQNNPHESRRFSLKENEVESFLGQRGFNTDEHLGNLDIERKFLIDTHGLLIGHILGAFRFVLASTANNEKK
jgi:methyltransferase (TIGR00027 family)